MCICMSPCLCRELMCSEGAWEGHSELGLASPLRRRDTWALSEVSLTSTDLLPGDCCPVMNPDPDSSGGAGITANFSFQKGPCPSSSSLASATGASRVTHHPICPGLSELASGRAGSGSRWGRRGLEENDSGCLVA